MLTMHPAMHAVGDGPQPSPDSIAYDVMGLPPGNKAIIRKEATASRWRIKFRRAKSDEWDWLRGDYPSADAALAALPAEFSRS